VSCGRSRRGPPPRPPGVPDFPEFPSGGWLEWRKPADGKFSTRWVWAWIQGAWRYGSVRAEGRTPSGWWFSVWWPSDPEWVHESRTMPWAPSPELIARWRQERGQPPLSPDEIIAQIREEFGG
jgi:hypothetical protein